MTQSAPVPDRLKQLEAQRESIEREIAEIRAALVLPLDAPLVDAQGFPRADVDLFRAREQRQRVIELQNDLKRVIDDLYAALTADDSPLARPQA